jgi:hypothetical protein
MCGAWAVGNEGAGRNDDFVAGADARRNAAHQQRHGARRRAKHVGHVERPGDLSLQFERGGAHADLPIGKRRHHSVDGLLANLNPPERDAGRGGDERFGGSAGFGHSK